MPSDASTGAVAPAYETNDAVDMYLRLHYPSESTERGERFGYLADDGRKIRDGFDAPRVGPAYAETRFPSLVADVLRRAYAVRDVLRRKDSRGGGGDDEVEDEDDADIQKRLREVSVHVDASARALDIGCAVGGSAFRLAETFVEVIGIDASEMFVDVAKKMQTNGELKYMLRAFGDLGRQHVARASPSEGADAFEAVAARCEFRVGDACALGEQVESLGGRFDAVLVSNLLCRVAKPRKVLDALAELVKEDGLVLIVSPFSWSEEYTPREEWIGGTETQGNSPLALKSEMDKRGFVEVCMKAVIADAMVEPAKGLLYHTAGGETYHVLPCTIQEHERKFQCILSVAQCFKKTREA